MDQNQNNNLFNFDNQPPQEPPQPAEPAITSGGAQVYDMPPGQQPVEPPSFNPPPSFTTPPPPTYNPPPSTATQPPKSNRTIWIVVIVAVVLLCCCCVVLAGVWLYNNGDQILQQYGAFVPGLLSMLA